MPSPAPITGRRIRFALAGCGRIWKNHVDALKQRSGDAEIVAVCDTDPKALQAGSKVAGAPQEPTLNLEINVQPMQIGPDVYESAIVFKAQASANKVSLSEAE